MSSIFGDKIRISVFGESHGKAIGVVIDSLPPGEIIDLDKVFIQMQRRAPGKDGSISTQRKESDMPVILSGMIENTTTGAPLCAMIENTNTVSKDYSQLKANPRPGHSDYPAYVKYNGFNDIRGGGHFSGRLTAPIVFAGSIIRQILEKKGIKIAAHISKIGNICDDRFDPVYTDDETIKRLNLSSFALLDETKEEAMRKEIENAKKDGDSIGGMIECMIKGLPCGIGGPMFDSIESMISKAVFSIPAVKGIEFGKGFDLSEMRGSQSNDEYYMENGNIKTKTNNCGGILGGISNGMPVVFNTVIKPTPSISKTQDTVNLVTNENTKINIQGRHDPCIVPRAVPAIEAITAVAVINMLG